MRCRYSMLRMALAPSTCFNVTDELMMSTARLARRHPGVRLHTHLAETEEETALAQRICGCGLGKHLRCAADMVWPPVAAAQHHTLTSACLSKVYSADVCIVCAWWVIVYLRHLLHLISASY